MKRQLYIKVGILRPRLVVKLVRFEIFLAKLLATRALHCVYLNYSCGVIVYVFIYPVPLTYFVDNLKRWHRRAVATARMTI